jgi:3-oxoacyl-[acyl-carrier protein] reductase
MGRAVAQSLAGEGARIAVLARTQGALDETVVSLRSLGAPDAVGLATDLTSWESVERALETLGERWQSLNILVNAARPVDVGIGLFEDVDDEEWQATFDIGTVSAARCVRAALPLLR